MTTKLAGCFSY